MHERFGLLAVALEAHAQREEKDLFSPMRARTEQTPHPGGHDGNRPRESRKYKRNQKRKIRLVALIFQGKFQADFLVSFIDTAVLTHRGVGPTLSAGRKILVSNESCTLSPASTAW
jgi:hypothetical protein